MATGFEIEGDLVRDVAPYLGAWGRLLTLLRETAVGRVLEVGPQDDPFPDSDNAIGRYARYAVDDVDYRVYYEEAGAGDVPVLFVHTAGADSRQYRHVLADPDLQKRYRLIAMDLPYHGRSLPPTSVRWWERHYRPGRELLMAWIVGLIEALGLDRPIFVGCSVGGQLATDLCAHWPQAISGAIGINGLHDMAPYEGAFDNEQFRDPRVPTEYYAAMNFGATSPLAPEPFKRELYWIYRSNFPGVYAGDNDYYMFEHDLRVDGDRIDTSRTPLLMLTGQYDASALLPEVNALKIAEAIPGATAEMMDGLGHFAPTDDPLGFRKWFNPALDELHRRAVAAPLS
jgi:pimeloyl-ACP methyl ester carboxylesterase